MGGIKNNKSLGQHWLNNRAILDEIARLAVEESAYYSSEKTGVDGEKQICFEIGPGLGTLTSSLFKYFEKVIAIEFDNRLATNLPKSFPGKNLEVINEDVLRFDFEKKLSEEKIANKGFVIVGNIPYYITSPIIEKVLMLKSQPVRIVLLVQKEVAERILDKKETNLSLFVKNRAMVKEGLVVSRDEFTPPPKVDSQVILFEPHDPIVSEDVFKIIKIGFLAPRKKLVHNLLKISDKGRILEVFKQLNINPDVRPGDLGLEDWRRLFEGLFSV